MAKDKRDEYEIEDFGGRMAKQAGGMTSLTIPPTLPKWKPKKTGSHTIDIIPFVVTENHMLFRDDLRNAREGKLYPERTYHTHRQIGVNTESFACPAMNYGKPCPICEDRIRLKARPEREFTERAYELKPKDRQLWLIWDNDDPDKGVQLWEEAVWNFGKNLVAYIEGARKEDVAAYKRFYHPVDGFTMRLTAIETAIGAKDGKKGGNNTTYTVHQFYPRARPIPRDIIHHGYDLDAMVRVLPYDALKAIYTGASDDDSDNGHARPATRSAEREGRDPRDEARSQPPERPRSKYDDPDDAPPPRAAKARDEDPEPPRRKAAPADEPAPPKRVSTIPFGTNDVVSLEYKGDIVRADVKKVNEERRTVELMVEGTDRVIIRDFEDCTLVRADDTFDAKPPKKAPPADDEPTPKRRPPADKDDAPPARGARKEWDDEPDGRTAAPKKAPPADDEPAPKRRPPADDDNDAPPKRRK